MVALNIIAEGLKFPEGPVAMADGSIVLVEIAAGQITRVLPSGDKQIVARPGGGPNGAALGPDGQLYVCNNGGFKWVDDPVHGLRPVQQADDYSGGRIERVDLGSGSVEVLYTRCGPYSLRGPNDLVLDGNGGFYFTDLGKVRPRDMDRGGVYWARLDGTEIREVVHPMMTPNGIGLSPDGRTLYVAETEGARLVAFDIVAPGEVRKLPWPHPHGGRLVGCPGGPYQRFDSMAVDCDGNVLVATLVNGGVTVYSPDGRAQRHIPLPDPYVTNLCFGGPDLRTLYVTLSGKGQLVSFPWERPGTKLHVT